MASKFDQIHQWLLLHPISQAILIGIFSGCIVLALPLSWKRTRAFLAATSHVLSVRLAEASLAITTAQLDDLRQRHEDIRVMLLHYLQRVIYLLMTMTMSITAFCEALAFLVMRQDARLLHDAKAHGGTALLLFTVVIGTILTQFMLASFISAIAAIRRDLQFEETQSRLQKRCDVLADRLERTKQLEALKS